MLSSWRVSAAADDDDVNDDDYANDGIVLQ
jgi:hypothetical protein